MISSERSPKIPFCNSSSISSDSQDLNLSEVTPRPRPSAAQRDSCPLLANHDRTTMCVKCDTNFSAPPVHIRNFLRAFSFLELLSKVSTTTPFLYVLRFLLYSKPLTCEALLLACSRKVCKITSDLVYLLPSWLLLSDTARAASIMVRLLATATTSSTHDLLMRHKPSSIQPYSIKALYTTALIVESFDNLQYLSLGSLMVPNRDDLAHGLTRTFMRANGIARIPFYMMVYLLRNYHIRNTEVGRVVGGSFVMYQLASTLLWYWSARAGEFEMKPLWYVVAWHGIWTAWGFYGLLGAE